MTRKLQFVILSAAEGSFRGATATMMKQYYVYILSSFTRTLYIGVTSDLQRRLREHKQKAVPGFTSKYNVDRLVFYQQFTDVKDAIAREKQLKGWTRKKKEALIEIENPRWEDIGQNFDG